MVVLTGVRRLQTLLHTASVLIASQLLPRSSQVLFPWLNGLRILRLKPIVEIVGADISKHGGSAYPDEDGDPFCASGHGGTKLGSLRSAFSPSGTFGASSTFNSSSAQIAPHPSGRPQAWPQEAMGTLYPDGPDGPAYPAIYPPSDPRSRLESQR